MEVVIQISTDTTTSGQSVGQIEKPLTLVRTTVAGLGLTLAPIHPGATDPILSTYFHVRVSDPETAARVIDAVRNLPSVSAAYAKPSAEPP